MLRHGTRYLISANSTTELLLHSKARFSQVLTIRNIITKTPNWCLLLSVTGHFSYKLSACDYKILSISQSTALLATAKTEIIRNLLFKHSLWLPILPSSSGLMLCRAHSVKLVILHNKITILNESPGYSRAQRVFSCCGPAR